MSTDLVRHALSGATMGTRWQATFFAPIAFGLPAARVAFQAAVDEVDFQMSTWKPDSNLMRLNASPVGAWVAVPDRLCHVLQCGLAIGRASGGAFDIGTGDAVMAWGFGPHAANSEQICSIMSAPRKAAHEMLEIRQGHVRKSEPLTLDLNGIAKGYGVDRLAETLGNLGLDAGLVGIDGEMRVSGLRPDGQGWTIAIEGPDPGRRAPYAILALQDAAVATSGDYRHRVLVQGRHLSHTMDPRLGAPLRDPPASVTVIHESCMAADAWATALMVIGSARGAIVARNQNLNALFMDREDDQLRETRVGRLFETGSVCQKAL